MLPAKHGGRQPSLLLFDHPDDLRLGETAFSSRRLLLQVGQTLHQSEGTSGEQVSEEVIPAAFFVTPQIVTQRLTLASVAPALLELYAEDGMTHEQLMAFTVKPDHGRQVQVWDAVLFERGALRHPAHVDRDVGSELGPSVGPAPMVDEESAAHAALLAEYRALEEEYYGHDEYPAEIDARFRQIETSTGWASDWPVTLRFGSGREGRELLRIVLLRGEVDRGDVAALLGVAPRTARATMKSLLDDSVVGSKTPRSALMLRFPSKPHDVLFPPLFDVA